MAEPITVVEANVLLFVPASAMKKRTTRKSLSLGKPASFQWQVREDAQEEAETLLDLPVQRGVSVVWVVAATVLLVGVGWYWGGDYLLGVAEENLLDEEVVQPILVEAELVEGLESDIFTPNMPLLDSNIKAEWGEGVDLLEIQGDKALVSMVITRPSEPWHHQPYRVARVLQQDGKGWQLIEPASVFWSARRTLETNFFEINYSAHDASAVEETVGDLENLYVTLHEDLALPKPTAGERMKFNITVIAGSPVRVPDLTYSGDTLIIPPPDLIPRPIDMSNAEALRQAISYVLTVKLFTERQEKFPAACEWNALAEGVGLWLRWEGHTLPSRRHWLYQSTLNEWRPPAANSNAMLPRLDDLLAFPMDCSRPPTILEAEVRNSGPAVPRPELASTLIAYMAATYGRQFVPLLLRDTSEFSDWESLSQQSVHVSAQELESGWHTYLTEHLP